MFLAIGWLGVCMHCFWLHGSVFCVWIPHHVAQGNCWQLALMHLESRFLLSFLVPELSMVVVKTVANAGFLHSIVISDAL